MTETASGYLLLADISGYTAFLSDSELDHARDTLTDLLALMIDHTKAPLTISKLEGDAVFSYTWGEEPFKDGQALVESIENTYVAFRRAVELMVMNNTCRCAACANVSMLDLKFFVHHGRFAQQDLGRHVELVGSDVNLVHRLTKNRVKETTQISAYTMYTEAAVLRLGIEAIAGTMTPHVESYEHLGDVRLWIQDMHPVWAQRREDHRVDFEPFMAATADIALPPEVVWGYLRQPEFRSMIQGYRVSVRANEAGRIGPESQFQCFHGKQVLSQRIVEWTPFERIVSQDTDTMPMMKKLTWRNEYRLAPTDTGTRLRIGLGDFTGSKLAVKAMTRSMSKEAGRFEHRVRAFAAAVEADWAAQRADAAGAATIALTTESIREAAAASLRPA